MRAANRFANHLKEQNLLGQVGAIRAELFGSLGATGVGHGSPKAIMLGLEGEFPETVDVAGIADRIKSIESLCEISLAGEKAVSFDPKHDLILHRNKTLPQHPNGMLFSVFDNKKTLLCSREYYSVGGGFIHQHDGVSAKSMSVIPSSHAPVDQVTVPYPFTTAEQLLEHCQRTGMSISDIMWANEQCFRERPVIISRLNELWTVMQQCVEKGINTEGTLPGGLQVKRRARLLHQQLLSKPETALSDPLTVMDWVSLYALAVNEENAAGGRMVTAPTNGAAGIIPAVLHYHMRFCQGKDDDVHRFFLVAAAIGTLYKENASISGAEVGCQGEVGSACSMAAGALTEIAGGTPGQVENAAEIAMEHNLGLTCDPIGGLVQVPCIERNAMAAIKAISASRMALRGDGTHFVPLDKVIKTMRDTGRDMQDKYKETARGGLATNVIEVPVNIIEC